MSRLERRILGLMVGLTSSGLCSCSGGVAAEASTGEVSSQVVYGRDDRVEPAAALPEWAAIGAQSTLALIPGRRLARDAAGVQVKALSLQQTVGVCPDDPFIDEPTASECSAVLIDDDLVLTAGHCFPADDDCDRFAYVFDYASGPNGVTIPEASVFGCRALIRPPVTSEQSSPPDFAIVQLDRATGRTPVALAAALPAVGGRLVALGYPSGLPLKVDSGGVVLRTSFPDARQFTATIDAFQGNSGGPIFDADYGLVGILVAGAPTDYETHGGCQRPRRVEPTPDGGERILTQSAVLDALCGMQYPSARLCGATERCGDGSCSPAEADADCAADCHAALCSGFDCLAFPEPPPYELMPGDDAAATPTPAQPAPTVPPAPPAPSCNFNPRGEQPFGLLALLLGASAIRFAQRRRNERSEHTRPSTKRNNAT